MPKFGIEYLKLILRPVLASVESLILIDRNLDGKVSTNEGIAAISMIGFALAPAFPLFDEAGDELKDLDAQEFETLLDWAEQEFRIVERELLTQIVRRTLHFIKYNHNYVRFLASALKKAKEA